MISKTFASLLLARKRVDFHEINGHKIVRSSRPWLMTSSTKLKEVISGFRSAFPDIHWVIEEMVGEGEKVFSRFTWHGTHRGQFFGIPATGKEITAKGMVVDRVVAGKMVESQILMDGLSMMRQLGVIPA